MRVMVVLAGWFGGWPECGGGWARCGVSRHLAVGETGRAGGCLAL